MTDKYKNENITTIDGVKIDFDNDWVHLRKSRNQLFVSHRGSITRASRLALRIIDEIKAIAGI
jgi:phosphomannomutase